MASCRSCQAPIIWATTAAGGKSMPVDQDPTDDGNVELNWPPDPSMAPLATVHTQTPLGSTTPLHLSHFATCTEPEKWRQPRPATGRKR